MTAPAVAIFSRNRREGGFTPPERRGWGLGEGRGVAALPTRTKMAEFAIEKALSDEPTPPAPDWRSLILR